VYCAETGSRTHHATTAGNPHFTDAAAPSRVSRAEPPSCAALCNGGLVATSLLRGASREKKKDSAIQAARATVQTGARSAGVGKKIGCSVMRVYIFFHQRLGWAYSRLLPNSTNFPNIGLRRSILLFPAKLKSESETQRLPRASLSTVPTLLQQSCRKGQANGACCGLAGGGSPGCCAASCHASAGHGRAWQRRCTRDQRRRDNTEHVEFDEHVESNSKRVSTP
jgi:hypothetical protein